MSGGLDIFGVGDWPPWIRKVVAVLLYVVAIAGVAGVGWLLWVVFKWLVHLAG
jgi:hypothetical protein